MTAVVLTPTAISASQDRGTFIDSTRQAAVAVVIGDLVYLDSSNLLRKAIATALASSKVYGMVVGGPQATYFGETTIAALDYPAVAVGGNVYGDFTISGNVVANGVLLYLSKTVAGGMDDAAPTSAYQTEVARASGPESIFLMPGMSSPVSA